MLNAIKEKLNRHISEVSPCGLKIKRKILFDTHCQVNLRHGCYQNENFLYNVQYLRMMAPDRSAIRNQGIGSI